MGWNRFVFLECMRKGGFVGSVDLVERDEGRDLELYITRGVY